MLARDPGSFYTGELAERAVAALRAGGAPFSGDEWAAGATVPTEPAAHRTLRRCDRPPDAAADAGWMVLQQAALCDGVVGHTPWLSADAIDCMARAARMAFEDRLDLCGSANTGAGDVLAPEPD